MFGLNIPFFRFCSSIFAENKSQSIYIGYKYKSMSVLKEKQRNPSELEGQRKKRVVKGDVLIKWWNQSWDTDLGLRQKQGICITQDGWGYAL